MKETQPPSDGGDGGNARVRAALDGWKRKLLDLTKRNRALNFKPTKVSTIAIVDEQPAEVFRRLYLEERPMRFKAAPQPEGEPSQAASSTEPPSESPEREVLDSDEGTAALELDFVPYDSSSLDEKHADEYLQTAAQPDALDKSLRRIDEQAHLALEEQGVNTLFLGLGMLHYKESADSDVVLKAPLVLLPVRLERKSARSGYSLQAADDDPLVNPALREYVKRSFGTSMPDLPTPDAIADDYDLQTLFAAIRQSVSAQNDWAVKTDIYLGLFSFQKFVMYKDLDANTDVFAKHRLMSQLVTRSGTQVVGLPTEIRTMDLDGQFPPEATFQVVDADSSQSRALAAAAHGHDVVVEGPPGTGKSQTITNLIAQALASDKSVLFVAEKMAALEVVHNRLVQAGIGEFCLELHSTKANKRRVMQDLATALDASLQTVAATTVSTQRLPQVRQTLNDYIQAVHAPYGTLAASPFRAYGELGTVLNAPRVTWSGEVDVVTREQLEQTDRDLRDLASQAAYVGDPLAHPWRGATKTFYSPGDLEAIEDAADNTLEALDDLARRARAVELGFGLPAVRTFADVDIASTIADALARSPGAPPAVLSSDAWSAPPPEAVELVRRLKVLCELKDQIGSCLRLEVLEHDHASDIAYLERKSEGVFSFLAFLDGRYRAICKRWKTYRLDSYSPRLLEQAATMCQVDKLRAERRALVDLDANGRQLFGGLWKGEESDRELLQRYIAWVVELRSLVVKHGLTNRTLELASTPATDVSEVRALRESGTRAATALEVLREAVGWPSGYLTDQHLTSIADRVRTLRSRLAAGPQWAAFEAARQTAAQGVAAELLPPASAGHVAYGDLPSAFKRAFFLKWISQVVGARPALAKFHTMTHEERVAEFRNLDSRVLLENRAALVGQLRDRVQHKLQRSDAVAALPFLRREMARQRHFSPLRRTLHEAEPAIRAIKPCFLMSPLTVAQYLRGGTPTFDLMIFDEASQLPPEDAVGAICRGQQLIVVGDPKQLPPTAFFMSSLSPEETHAPDGAPLYQDAESVLEDFMGAGIPMSRLKWHYRSTHESLITFSNVNFYDADLYTFPSVETGTEQQGLSFEYIDGAMYEGKGLNIVEARRVADEVALFAREQLDRQERGEPTLSLGVGTFNLRQQLAIQDEIELRRRDDPRIEPFFDRGLAEPFFVKNLENIQGDERDIIFISVTYAKGSDGKLRYNFGPLNGQNGWRRLNVLTTRARKRMRVFSSMHGDEINLAATATDGPRLLREFLLYAERGRLESTLAARLAPTESPFERDVITELTRRGVTTVPQVGVAGYRIDIGVLDDELPGRFVCGIECDGVAYHSSESARDRDRLRQQVLEARGWTLARVWSTDWFKDRVGQIDRLMTFVDRARKRASEEASAIREARERTTAQEHDAEGTAATDSPVPRSVPSHPSTRSTNEYRRPSAVPYELAPGEDRFAGSDIQAAPEHLIATAIQSVVDVESPIHLTDLLSRVASMWGNRAGSRIQVRILDISSKLIARGQVKRRGEFFWNAADTCTVRSRAGRGIPADRIAPEEFERAVLAVLGNGHSFPRPQLTNEVRSMLGYARTGAIIDEAVTAAVERLLAAGKLGEGSAGLAARRVE